MKVTATAVVTFEIPGSDDAHALGQELENRLVSNFNALIPNLRNAQQIQSGEVKISVRVEGRTLRIRRPERDRLQVEGVEGQKKK
tara:strand:+ start:179 stop:433 length:255 start_codon:yes stop_codon:yes gene_type:complete